jgi:hypothetical protein
MGGMPEADSMRSAPPFSPSGSETATHAAPGELPRTEQNPIEALGVDSLIDVGG